MLDKKNILNNIVKRSNLSQIIDKATRSDSKTVNYIPSTKSSLIDVLIISNSKSKNLKKTNSYGNNEIPC